MFMRDHVAEFPIEVMCETLGVSRSGYYAWARRAESARSAADRALIAEIRTAQGMLCSMSRQGDCRDNAPMESFFATLNGELVKGAYYHSRDQARARAFYYIECFCIRRRLHAALGYIKPEDKAAAFHSAAQAA